MRILVSAASKHGATAEIARDIADVLAELGHETSVQPPDHVDAVDGYDAVVLGSAVYAGHWLGAAKRLAEQHGEPLRRRPVWLFSSGPLGDPPKPTEDPLDAADVVRLTGAVEHRVFAGRLDRRTLGLAERAICAALRVEDGDFRSWPEIRAWASQIGRDLPVEPAVATA
jgi:menaquinone-dependent protoporphyrinogen oxidase